MTRKQKIQIEGEPGHEYLVTEEWGGDMWTREDCVDSQHHVWRETQSEIVDSFSHQEYKCAACGETYDYWRHVPELPF